MDNCQIVETQMKIYILNDDSAQKLEDLEGRTFGQLLNVFKRHCTNTELLEWLESLRQFRNDVAHTFFRDVKLMRKQFGKGTDQLNQKALRKGLRIGEICHGMLKKLR